VLILLAWIRLATLLFALFFGTLNFPPMDQLLADLLFTAPGLGMLATGTVIGAALAFTVFAVSAVSVPLLMERDIDAVTAALTSLRAVRANLRPMLLWAWLIALIIVSGMVPLFFGLIVAFPLIGHATWHAYRDLVG